MRKYKEPSSFGMEPMHACCKQAKTASTSNANEFCEICNSCRACCFCVCASKLCGRSLSSKLPYCSTCTGFEGFPLGSRAELRERARAVLPDCKVHANLHSVLVRDFAPELSTGRGEIFEIIRQYLRPDFTTYETTFPQNVVACAATLCHHQIHLERQAQQRLPQQQSGVGVGIGVGERNALSERNADVCEWRLREETKNSSESSWEFVPCSYYLIVPNIAPSPKLEIEMRLLDEQYTVSITLPPTLHDN